MVRQAGRNDDHRQPRGLEAHLAERDRFLDTVYRTRGWWVLSKLSNFQDKLKDC